MKRALTCMIIDDELKSIRVLEYYVELLPQLRLLATETNPFRAQEKLLTEQVDFILLDGEMPGMDGVQLVQSLPNPPKVIMCTGHERFAIRGYDIKVVDFLLKPFSFERFTNAIHDVFQALEVKDGYPPKKKIENDFFFVSETNTPYMVKISVIDIQYIESRRNYIIVYTLDGKVTTRFTLADMMEKLHADDFIQVQKSFVVAQRLIQKYSATNVFLRGLSKPIPVSSKYVQDLRAAMERDKVQ